MQATLDSGSLKPFTKAVACLSKYGDEVIIRASSDVLSLSSVNSSRTAYCNIQYSRDFFLRYNVGHRAGPSNGDNGENIALGINTKALLTVLHPRSAEKSIESCELIITEGEENPDESRDDEDSLESRLVLRLHCKSGVVKTHRMLLNTPDDSFVPTKAESDADNRIVARPRTLKDMIDHFPVSKSSKADPALRWRFDVYEVFIRSTDSVLTAKGKSQLATELTVSAEDFEMYDVHVTPMTIAFQLREFNACVALADGMSVPLEITLVSPSEPLCIKVETDDCKASCIIATVDVSSEDDFEPRPSAPQQQPPPSNTGSNRAVSSSNPRKRERDEEHTPTPRPNKAEFRKPMKVVQKADSAIANAAALRGHGSQQSVFSERRTLGSASQASHVQHELPNQSLFLASQVSNAGMDAILASGLGIEDMNEDEFAAMFEDEGEEVNVGPSQTPAPSIKERTQEDEDEMMVDDGDGIEYVDTDEDAVEMGPTQLPLSDDEGEKPFIPLFED